MLPKLILIFIVSVVLVQPAICPYPQDNSIFSSPLTTQNGPREDGLVLRQAGTAPLIPLQNQVLPIVPLQDQQSGLPMTNRQQQIGRVPVVRTQQQPMTAFLQVPASSLLLQWPHQITQTFTPGLMQMQQGRPILYQTQTPSYNLQQFQQQMPSGTFPGKPNTAAAAMNFHGNQGNAFSSSLGPTKLMYQGPFQFPPPNGGIVQLISQNPHFIPVLQLGPSPPPPSRPVPQMPPIEYPTPPLMPPPATGPLGPMSFGSADQSNAGIDGSQQIIAGAGTTNTEAVATDAAVSLEAGNTSANDALGNLVVNAVGNGGSEEATISASQNSEDSSMTKLTQPVLVNSDVGLLPSMTKTTTGSIPSSIIQDIKTTALDEGSSLFSSAASKITDTQQSVDQGIHGITLLQNSALNDFLSKQSGEGGASSVLSPNSATQMSNFESSNQESSTLLAAKQVALVQSEGDLFNANANSNGGGIQFQSASNGGTSFATGTSSSVSSSGSVALGADVQVVLDTALPIINEATTDETNDGAYAVTFSAKEANSPLLELSSGSLGTGYQVSTAADVGPSMFQGSLSQVSGTDASASLAGTQASYLEVNSGLAADNVAGALDGAAIVNEASNYGETAGGSYVTTSSSSSSSSSAVVQSSSSEFSSSVSSEVAAGSRDFGSSVFDGI